jgi:hypothetical protein
MVDIDNYVRPSSKSYLAGEVSMERTTLVIPDFFLPECVRLPPVRLPQTVILPVQKDERIFFR